MNPFALLSTQKNGYKKPDNRKSIQDFFSI